MNIVTLLYGTAIACALCATGACTQDASGAGNGGNSSDAAGGGTWSANGATACDKYLTPDFVGQIFKNPAGHSKQLSAQACSFQSPDFSTINITLVAGGPATFDAHQPFLTHPVPLTGVGDKAVHSATGIEAVKGNDRMCDIDVMPPFGNKLSGEALAQKVGEICNKLFALP